MAVAVDPASTPSSLQARDGTRIEVMDALGVEVIEAYEDVESNAVAFERPGLSRISAPRRLVLSSKLLKDLFQTADESDRVRVPVPWKSLQLWLQHIQQRACSLHALTDAAPTAELMGTVPGASPSINAAGQYSTPEAGGVAGSQEMGAVDEAEDENAIASPEAPAGSSYSFPTTMEERCELLKVADVLIDETTTDRCALKISQLFHSGTDFPILHEREAVLDLPEHLQFAVLSRVPLVHILDAFPAVWHPIGLRAHYPSIDATSSLSIHRFPVASIPAALASAAATGVNRILNLSLAGLTLPRGPQQDQCMEHLGDMPWLTALNLHDTGLQDTYTHAAGEAPADCVLMTNLLKLTNLESLDMSSNHLRTWMMMAIGCAISYMPRLSSLNLLNTLSVMPGEEQAIGWFAQGLQASVLRGLTALSIGVFGYGLHLSSPPAAEGIMDVLSALVHMTGLQSLRLELFESDPSVEIVPDTSHAPEVIRRIGMLSSLRSLHLTVPAVTSETPLQQVGSCLTRLTALNLDIFANSLSGNVPQVEHAAFVLGGITSCVALEELCVSMPVDNDHQHASEPCTTLAGVLPSLPRLASLRVHAYRSKETTWFVLEPGIASVNAILQAATVLPSLTQLHIPVSGSPETVDLLEEYVQSLVKSRSAGVVDVSVELCMIGRGDHISGEVFRLCQPLFPFVESLRLNFGDEVPSQGLSAAASGLTRLKSVFLWGEEPEWPWSETGWAPFLNQVSCLRSLEKLDCMLTTSGEQRTEGVYLDPELSDEDGEDSDGGEGDTDGALRPFLRGLGGLEHLSRVTFCLENTSEWFHERFFRACGEIKSLKYLETSGFEQWQWPVFEEVFPKLDVRTLFHELGTMGDTRTAVRVRDAVGHALHLRVLRVMGDYLFPLMDDEHLAIYDATAELPGFQLLSAKSFRPLDAALYERLQQANGAGDGPGVI